MVDNQTETSTKNSRKISGKQIGYIQCFVTREGDPRWLSLGKVPRDLCIATTVVHLVNVNIKMVLRLCLVRVKAFPENILFFGNAIFRKGK